MQREEADPAGGVDRVLMRMIARLGNQVGNVVNRDDGVEDHDHDEYSSSKAK